MSKQEFLKTMTPMFRVSFPEVFQAKAIQEGQTPKYSIQMLFDKEARSTDAYKKIIELCKKAVINKWGSDKSKWPKTLRKTPFRDGSEKDYEGYGEGIKFATATSKNKPGIVDANLQAIISPEDFYAGCYAQATVNVFAWEYMGKAGVSFGLNNIQKLKDGEPFSGRKSAEDDFEVVEDFSDDLDGVEDTAGESSSDDDGDEW